MPNKKEVKQLQLSYSKTICAKRQLEVLKESSLQKLIPWDAVQNVCIGFQDDFTNGDKQEFKTNIKYNLIKADDISIILDTLEIFVPNVDVTWLKDLLAEMDNSHKKEFSK